MNDTINQIAEKCAEQLFSKQSNWYAFAADHIKDAINEATAELQDQLKDMAVERDRITKERDELQAWVNRLGDALEYQDERWGLYGNESQRTRDDYRNYKSAMSKEAK